MSKTKNKTENKTEKALAAEKEQFGKQQLHNISKTLTSAETPPKEKYVRNIILGSHKEGGASTFWSYTLNLPLSSNSLISWKFCYLLHKLLRDGHRNAVADSHRHCRNVKDMGVLWGNLHDRYGHIVALSAKFLCLKMEFHKKHKVIPGNLEASDETLEREAGSDTAKVLDMTQELLDYMEAGLKMAETVLRQLDANGAKPSSPAGQCRLTPLIPLVPDCSFLYHFSVRLMFKLHSRISPDTLLGHRERFRDLFMSLTQFFDRAREMEFFKSVIQIPDLPDAPPNFLRAAALAEYKKPVVVMPSEERQEEEDEPQLELREQQQAPQFYAFNQMGAPDVSLEHREADESLKRELEVLKPELQLFKSEAQRCVTELKAQVNHLEAEVEEQRTHKQMAMLENEHLRLEVEALRSANVANVGAQIGFKEADGRAQAAELRFTQLKEKHAELVTSHADLMKKSAETVRMLSSTKQDQDELLRAKRQLESELESLRREKLDTVNQQQQEAERLNRELLEHRAELALLRSSLDSKEKVGLRATSPYVSRGRSCRKAMVCDVVSGGDPGQQQPGRSAGGARRAPPLRQGQGRGAVVAEAAGAAAAELPGPGQGPDRPGTGGAESAAAAAARHQRRAEAGDGQAEAGAGLHPSGAGAGRRRPAEQGDEREPAERLAGGAAGRQGRAAAIGEGAGGGAERPAAAGAAAPRRAGAGAAAERRRAGAPARPAAAAGLPRGRAGPEAAGGAVLPAAVRGGGGRGHRPGRRGQAGRPRARPLRQLPRLFDKSR